MKKKQVDYNNPLFWRGFCEQPEGEQSTYESHCSGCAKLDSYDWLAMIPIANHLDVFDCVEVRFKNSRKEFFRVPPETILRPGDIVAVEANPGHDIGLVTLIGEACRIQMANRKVDPVRAELKKIYRRARPADIEKWVHSVKDEETAIIKTRQITQNLKLGMKMNDVEFQGDGTKAIFYYTADDRVDFRELIKILAENFRVRIEMKQIGIRQEASRVGGIGTCGRELCCSTFLTSFRTVSTHAARIQQLSLNPQKLAGQCGKLKCCLNYEYEVYEDALKAFPDIELSLKSKKGEATCQKIDVFKGIMWYSYVNDQGNFLAIPLDKVKEILNMNEKGRKPEKLEDFARKEEQKSFFESVVGQDDLRRFDTK
ncbi:MAG: regulatory iron-sulfur-containing complex subunit RicT [Bacteroidales bacterium]|nr:regulatory iron-sulfur-containing complex subunit RicT [Bacteroidales bacterium]